MITTWHRKYGLLGLIILAGLLVWMGVPCASAQESEPKQVLVLHSYHVGLNWTDDIMQGIRDVFSAQPVPPRMDVEFMDTKRNESADYRLHILEDYLVGKLSGKQFDLVLLSDNAALDFVRRHRHDLFEGVPVVFCGINNFTPALIEGMKEVAGVAEILDVEKTMELGLRLHPQTEEAVFIGRTEVETGRLNDEMYHDAARKFEDRVQIRFWNDLPLETLKNRLAALGPHSLVFLGTEVKTGAGEVLSFAMSARQVRDACPVPIYSFWDFFLGNGIVGGKLVSGRPHGKLAAQLAVRILAGESPGNLPIIYSESNPYMFDCRELDRFEISREMLPKNSLLINKAPPFLEISKRELWVALALMGLLLLSLLVLLLARQRAVRELRRERDFSNTLVQSTAGFYVAIGVDGKTLMMNETMLKALGYVEEEVVGKDYISHFVHEDMRLKVSALFDRILNKGESTLNESRIVTREGEAILVEWHGRPVFRANGELDYFFGLGIDITARRQAEEELQAAHRQLQDIIEFLPDATLVIDREKKVVAWNRAMEELTGVPKAQMIGKGDFAYAVPLYGHPRPFLLDLLDSENLDEGGYASVSKRGDLYFVESDFIPAAYGGQGAYFWAVATRLYDSNGTCTGAIESIRDITERKKMEADLKHAVQELDAFVYTVSHDLRTPLTVINGYAELLWETSSDRLDAQERDGLDQIQGACERMMALMEDLLTLAKVGRVPPPEKPVDPGPIVQEVIDTLAAPLAENGLTVEVGDLPTVWLPATLLFQIFANLIGNAALYAGSPNGGIEVGGGSEGSVARLYVRDHGPGVAPEERERIFDTFYRGRVGKSRPGTGIGLATVHKIAEKYEGRVWVEQTPGGGSTFWVELPKGPLTVRREPGESSS